MADAFVGLTDGRPWPGTSTSPEVAGAVYDQVQALAAHPELSDQKREVLRLISEGRKPGKLPNR